MAEPLDVIAEVLQNEGSDAGVSIPAHPLQLEYIHASSQRLRCPAANAKKFGTDTKGFKRSENVEEGLGDGKPYMTESE